MLGTLGYFHPHFSGDVWPGFQTQMDPPSYMFHPLCMMDSSYSPLSATPANLLAASMTADPFYPLTFGNTIYFSVVKAAMAQVFVILKQAHRN